MKRHARFGLVAPELGWVPAPSYLLRRARVLAIVGRLEPGRVLEIGCGAGALLDDLSAMGWTCEAVETSARALRLAQTLHRDNSRVTVRGEMPPEAREFDLVAALEVLEHIDDDERAVAAWADRLRPGGRLILSVPAHRRRWGPSDVWAGHHRRYERQDLLRLLSGASLEPERVECYGFPLANVIAPFRALAHRRQLRRQREESPETRSARSGIERGLETRLFHLQALPPGSWMIALMSVVQNFFANGEWGTGYLVLARKLQERAG